MMYAWSKEPKLDIKHTRSPVDNLALSGVILVVDHGVGKCYVKFDLYVVEKIGHKMPYGLGPDNPGFIKIVKKHGYYDIMCSYIDKSKSIALWRSRKLPGWAKWIKYPQPSL